jgi:hypothetical protein
MIAEKSASNTAVTCGATATERDMCSAIARRIASCGIFLAARRRCARAFRAGAGRAQMILNVLDA